MATNIPSTGAPKKPAAGATVDTVNLETGAVKPTSKNQTTSSKATSLIESILTKPTMPTGLLYLLNCKM